MTTTSSFARSRSRPLAPPLWCVLIAGMVPAACGAESSRNASEWLDKMARAGQTLNYDGTFVYRNGSRIESMRIIHRADPEGSRERLVSLSGTAREVLRDESSVTCILPDNRSVMVGKSRPREFLAPEIFASDEALNKHYTLEVEAGDRVAGRATQRVTVKPVDRYRYGYRLWLDDKTGLLLQSELVGSGGMPLEQIVYTSISIPKHIPDSLLEPSISGEGFTWYQAPAAEKPPADSKRSGWRVAWLPAGFELSERAQDPVLTSRMPVEHLVYSDGVASLSVFIEQLESAAERLEGGSEMGAVRAYGRVIDDFQVTVVGEVPDITVKMVGNSIAQK